MSEETREQEALYNSFRTATFVARRDDGWLFDLGEGEQALVPNDDLSRDPGFQPGQQVELLVERPYGGFWAASASKVEKLKLWDEYEQLAQSGAVIEGTILGANKGGLSVDIGLRAFLPMSQVDAHRVDDIGPYLGRREKFRVTEFDKKRGNVVVSRRAVIAETRDQVRAGLLNDLAAGQSYEGVVRSVLDYGAFVDIGGGVEGLLHASNMSWGRIDHPSELLRPGDKVMVQVLNWDPGRQRLSLGRKQLLEDPWEGLAERHSEGEILTGKVVSLADFGAFVSVEPGLEGLVHVTEISWTSRIEHPREALELGQVVRVKIISIDTENRRLGLSLKRIEPNPWELVGQEVKPGDIITGPIKSIVDFGLFVELRPGVDALVHVSDLSWSEKIENPRERFKVGETITAKVLDIDAEAGRASLGIKQITSDPWESAGQIARVGEKVDVTITRLTDFGAFAEIVPGVEGLIHISELSDKRVERPAEVVKPGQSCRALVLSFDRGNQRISLSLKRDELDNDAVRGYADEGSATALGDVLRGRLGLGPDND